MKKWIKILILVIALMCSGCGADNTTKTEENPSEYLRVYGNHGRKPLSTISRQGMNSVYEKY